MSAPGCCRHCGPNPENGCVYPDRDFHQTADLTATWDDQCCTACDEADRIAAQCEHLAQRLHAHSNDAAPDPTAPVPTVVLLDNGWIAIKVDGSRAFPWIVVDAHGPDGHNWSWEGLQHLGIAAVLHRGDR